MSTGVSLKRVIDKDDVAMELVYTSLIAYPDLERASRFMAEQGYTISTAKLAVYRDGHTPKSEIFRERRAELAPKLEAMLADDMLSEARLSTEVISTALETTQRLLNEGRVPDPSRVARDISQIRTQGVDKRLALQGRPTSIVEKRSPDELVRALESLGVAKQVELEVPDAEVVGD
jgi:hypothetical protein